MGDGDGDRDGGAEGVISARIEAPPYPCSRRLYIPAHHADNSSNSCIRRTLFTWQLFVPSRHSCQYYGILKVERRLVDSLVACWSAAQHVMQCKTS